MPAEKRYRFADVTVASAMALPELPPATRRPAWRVHLTRALPEPVEAWRHRWRVRGRPWLSVAPAAGGARLLRFAGAATFAVWTADGTIACRPDPGVPRYTVRHVLLNQVLPLLVSDGERLVLHGAAVARGQSAIAFVGPAGYGKSTLAALMERRGGRVIADDCLLLEEADGRIEVLPTFNGMRLRADSARAVHGRVAGARVAHWSAKRRVGTRVAGPMRARHLARVYVLGRPGRTVRRVTARRLTGQAAFMPLLRTTFQLDLDDRHRSRHLMAALASLVHTVPVYRLSYPRRYSALDELAAVVGFDAGLD